MSDLMKIVEEEYKGRRKKYPDFRSGDTINVHYKIIEGGKERIQQFKGTVIQRKNPNTNGETFTVRKISGEIGVERIFPIISPFIDKIEIVKRGKVRQARIYYLRELKGKSARIKGRIHVKETFVNNDPIIEEIETKVAVENTETPKVETPITNTTPKE